MVTTSGPLYTNHTRTVVVGADFVAQMIDSSTLELNETAAGLNIYRIEINREKYFFLPRRNDRHETVVPECRLYTFS